MRLNSCGNKKLIFEKRESVVHLSWGRGPVFPCEAPGWCNLLFAPLHAAKHPRPDGSWNAERSRPSPLTWTFGWIDTVMSFCHQSLPHMTLKENQNNSYISKVLCTSKNFHILVQVALNAFSIVSYIGRLLSQFSQKH